MIWSTADLLDTELKHLEKVFIEKNNYPNWVNRQIHHHVLSKH